MTDMVERVADAIEAAYRNDDDSRVVMTSMARAAIEAMREPTQDMILANRENGGLDFSQHVINDWQAMIDAALNPPSPA